MVCLYLHDLKTMACNESFEKQIEKVCNESLMDKIVETGT